MLNGNTKHYVSFFVWNLVKKVVVKLFKHLYMYIMQTHHFIIFYYAEPF